jgi:hypothetical protein
VEKLGDACIRTFLSKGWTEDVSNYRIRKDSGYPIRNFSELVSCVARLGFYNREHVLLFRGQSKDYLTKTQKLSAIKPSIFRPDSAKPWDQTLEQRFRRLRDAEAMLVEMWKSGSIEEPDRIRRYQNLRWTVLQHYEVCDTPLLDVTHSLRIAAAFASLGNTTPEAYVFVLAVPQISGAVTASAEAGLQIIRLSSACPPSAQRPHFQEGYLLGEYPEIHSTEQKDHYSRYEVDFGRRLLCKFRLQLSSFWNDREFPKITECALYPDRSPSGLDPLARVSDRIKKSLGN